MKNKVICLFKVKWIIVALLLNGVTQGAVIVVDDPGGEVVQNGLCSIAEAIIHANDDAITTFDCPAGAGVDTIQLSIDITLPEVEYDDDINYGRTGTPPIHSFIIIDGLEHVLKRPNPCDLNGIVSTGEYRIFRNMLTGDLTLKNLSIENGCADGAGLHANGGAVLNHSGASLSIINSVFKSNQSNGMGGAVANLEGSIISEVTSSQFISNTATESGGAMVNNGSSDLYLIDRCEFIGNQATYGGGLINSDNATITSISNSTFYNNTSASDGGAINNTSADQSGAFIENIENSTFSGNSASNGGAIVNYHSGISAMNNLTFVDNKALGTGGSVWNFTNSAIGTIKNSLFKNNTQSSGNECSGAITGSDNLSNSATQNCIGSIPGSLTASRVGALAYNGAQTMTHALLPGSEAINASGVGATTSGQRGLGVDGARDIGAFEYFGCTISGMDVDGFTIQVGTAERLISAVSCANNNGNLLDSIQLSQDIVLFQGFENNLTYGRSGLPAITSAMIIDGQGHQLQRDSSLSCIEDSISDPNEFRFLTVTTSGYLDLQNISLKNGCVDSNIQHHGSGGAILNDGVMEIKNSILSGNVSASVYGGAIYNGSIVSVINNNRFSENRANLGGALFNDHNISKITNNTFSQNTSSLYGGGIFNQGAAVTMSNNTFSSNLASNGGAIFNLNNDGVISNLLNNTFTQNTAISGAGIDNRNNGSILLMENNLFFQNTRTPGSTLSEIDCYSSSLIVGENNLSDQSANNCAAGIAESLNLIVSPLLDHGCVTPLADGSCIKTHALLIGSDGIDSGNANATLVDQRGFLAIGGRDIGSFEYYEIPIFKNSFE